MRAAELPGGEGVRRRKKRLRGEEGLWARVARAQGKSVAEALEANTNSDFLLFAALLQEEAEARHNELKLLDLMVSEVAWQVYRIAAGFESKDSPKRTRDSFRLFRDKDAAPAPPARKAPPPRRAPPPAPSPRRRAEQSKAAWLALTGVGTNIQARTPPPQPPKKE